MLHIFTFLVVAEMDGQISINLNVNYVSFKYHFHAFLYIFPDDKDQKLSQKVLLELENIDDDCDQNDIAFVKIDDDNEAAEWGIDEIPTIVSVLIYNAYVYCRWNLYFFVFIYHNLTVLMHISLHLFKKR